MIEIVPLTVLRIESLPAGVEVRQANGLRVPVVLIQWPGRFYERIRTLGNELFVPIIDFLNPRDSDAEIIGMMTRCVHISRLPLILKNGIDVEPADRVIYVDSPSKSLEYGSQGAATGPDCDQALMVLATGHLGDALVRVPVSIDANELARLRATYPTEVAEGGKWLWFSRESREVTQRAGAYLSDYGRFIKGDPWEALKMLILIGDDMGRLIGRLQLSLGDGIAQSS